MVDQCLSFFLWPLCCLSFCLWLLITTLMVVYGVSRHLQHYVSYIVAVSFIGEGNWSTRRKPPTCRKSLTNLNHIFCIEYTSPLTGFELTTLVVGGTDCTGRYNPTTIRTRRRLPLVTTLISSSFSNST